MILKMKKSEKIKYNKVRLGNIRVGRKAQGIEITVEIEGRR